MAERRDYRNKDGEPLSGATTVIGQNLGWSAGALKHWAWKEGKAGRDYRKTAGKAADAGTLAHAMIEADLKSKPMPDTGDIEVGIVEKARFCYSNYLGWKANTNFEVFKTETPLISETHQYGLTPDCIASVNGKLSLFDWKSSNAIYESMLIQLASYRIGWEENYPEHPLIGGYYLLRISKESAAYAYYHWEDLSEAWECFLNLLNLHSRHKNLKKLVG